LPKRDGEREEYNLSRASSPTRRERAQAGAGNRASAVPLNPLLCEHHARNHCGALVMHILWIVIIGFVAGIIARFLAPGSNNPAGFILTTLLGIAGAFIAT
jgi:hypothetical protein